ncbi:protein MICRORCHIDIA 6-like isoform X2 [Cornus florida]|uniref:protein MICRORCHIDIA 6-like isoform X2 n=1 Tax=Cornus florida TaxID=4283 RepID=UPI002897A0AD|nr:protein MICRORCHIDIA 6-like isoform X2 [Cornus florida]
MIPTRSLCSVNVRDSEVGTGKREVENECVLFASKPYVLANQTPNLISIQHWKLSFLVFFICRGTSVSTFVYCHSTVLEMSSTNIVNLRSDDELRELDVKPVKLEPDLLGGSVQHKEYHKTDLPQHCELEAHPRRQGSEEKRSSNAISSGQSGTTDQEQSPINNTSLSSMSTICSAPLCRQFWNAGNYDDGLASKSTFQNGNSYLHIHPKFLHSNATSHKWAFGAIAELLDNAVDEVQNGATFVIVDKTTNPRNGSPALLIQDDGSGMDPEAIRRCMSFGFSDKKSKSAIGKYGNGFKTSSMRLGADAIVFSRHLVNRKLTQSIGLLSYTFLTQTGHDRIVVPMVDYEFNTSTGTMDTLYCYGNEHFMSNLSMLLQWSPYSTEAELLKQFDDIGVRGTKIIIYNLWLNDEGIIELDFDSYTEDIRIRRDAESIERRKSMAISEQHLANQHRFSLRAYLSILYLRIPESFRMILRGRVVEYHNLANDLKFPDFILYRPQNGRCVEGTVVTTIGFLKEAPRVNLHGFNVYHKNRLILPYWNVVSSSDNRGRWVVGVLEANFIEPTHNKQDFEKTNVFQKLEGRLREMTFEYWDCHCGVFGYKPKKKPRVSLPSQASSDCRPHTFTQPVVLSRSSSAIGSIRAASAGEVLQHPLAASSNYLVGRPGQSIINSQGNSQGAQLKRKEHGCLVEAEKVKSKTGMVDTAINAGFRQELQFAVPTNELDQEAMNLIQENKKLRSQCLEYKKTEKELNLKVNRLKSELGEFQYEYTRLLAESQLLDKVKEENNVC